MSNREKYKNKGINICDVLNVLSEELEDTVLFPFDGYLDGRIDDAVLTKILYINYRDSTRIRNTDIEQLKNHIINVLKTDDLEVLRKGELCERYYSIVDEIACGHGIKGIRDGIETREYNLTSFASKFCGSHNNIAPFWDNQVSDLLKYLGFQHDYRNYRAYVGALNDLRRENGLEKYSLRRIEHAMWIVTDKALRQ